MVFPNDTTAILTYRARQTLGPRDTSTGATTREVTDSSTWIKEEHGWKCAMHTESPAVTTHQGVSRPGIVRPSPAEPNPAAIA